MTAPLKAVADRIACATRRTITESRDEECSSPRWSKSVPRENEIAFQPRFWRAPLCFLGRSWRCGENRCRIAGVWHGRIPCPRLAVAATRSQQSWGWPYRPGRKQFRHHLWPIADLRPGGRPILKPSRRSPTRKRSRAATTSCRRTATLGSSTRRQPQSTGRSRNTC
jgi:hypothetical protein